MLNRKRKYFKELIEINGEQIPINIGEKKNGVYFEIVKRAIEQLDIALKIHTRVLVYRFDLHPTYFTGNNKLLSKFIKRIKQWIYRKYQIENIGYVWAREQERSKKQHYHLAIFLDGNKIQHPGLVRKKIKEMWTPYGHMPVIEKPFYFIAKDNQEARLKAIYRISYLGKIRGKGYRDEQAKDYQTSRLII